MTTQLMNAVKAHGRALLNGHTEEFANKVACAMMGILPTKSVLKELAQVANFEDTPPELRLKARWDFLHHNDDEYPVTLDDAMIADLDRELGEDGNFCANCGIPHQIHGDECGQDFGEPFIPAECDFGDDCEDYDHDAVFEDHMTDALGYGDLDNAAEFAQAVRDHEAKELRCGVFLVAPERIQETVEARRRAIDMGQDAFDRYDEDQFTGGDERNAPSVEVKLSDTPVGQLADNWREAEMAKAKAIDEHRIAGDAFRNAVADFRDSDEECPTRVIHESTLEEVERSLEDFEFIPSAFGVTTEPKLLRAIDLPTTEDYSRVQQWFETHEAMNQFLAGRCLFSDLTGGIRDESADIVGMWYVAVFNCGNRG